MRSFPYIAVNFLIYIMLLFVSRSYSQFLEVSYQNFIIRYDQSDEKRALAVAKILEKSIPVMQNFYQIHLDTKASIVLTRSQNEFQRLTRYQLPEWSAAVYVPQMRQIILKDAVSFNSPKQMEKELIHEISHLFFDYRFSDKSTPLWFNEGLAEYLSGEKIEIKKGVIISNALFANKIIPLINIDSLLSFSTSRAQLAYVQSLSAVIFLKRSFGNHGKNWNGFFNLYEKEDFQTALKDYTGMDPIDFEIKWYRWIRDKYKWFVIFNLENLIWFAMAVILIGALYAIRYRNRKILMQWESEEVEQATMISDDFNDEHFRTTNRG